MYKGLRAKEPTVGTTHLEKGSKMLKHEEQENRVFYTVF